jgi:hypothetical protein
VLGCRVSSVRMMRLRDTVTQLLFAVLCVCIPFVLSNIALKWFPDGPGMAPLRNGFKIVVLIAAYHGYVQWVETRSPFELSLQCDHDRHAALTRWPARTLHRTVLAGHA